MNNLLGIVIEKYASQWCNIIKPQKKQHYNEFDLGPRTFQINSLIITTLHFYTQNYQGQALHGTLYLPQNQHSSNCVIYLHANNGTRLSGAAIKEQILASGFAYAIFDFSGAGKSQGEFSTLGLNESRDALCVINYLKEYYPNLINFFLWGRQIMIFTQNNTLRCMGAFAALQLTLQYPFLITGLILDTPYYSIKQLFTDVISKRYHLPNFLISSVLDYLKQKITTLTQIDLFEVNLLEQFENHNQLPPCFFATSINDKLVDIKTVEKLVQNYPGVKEFLKLEGTHSQRRNDKFVSKACKFLRSILVQQQQQKTITQRSSSVRQFNYISPSFSNMHLQGIIRKPMNFCSPNLDNVPSQYFQPWQQVSTYQPLNTRTTNYNNNGYLESSVLTRSQIKNQLIHIDASPQKSQKRISSEKKATLEDFFNFTERFNAFQETKQKKKHHRGNSQFKTRNSDISSQNSFSIVKHNSVSNIYTNQNQLQNFSLKTFFPMRQVQQVNSYVMK